MVRYSQGSLGRVFVLRLEEGDVLNETVEAFAGEQGVQRALAFYVGGSTEGSRLVVGPDASRLQTISPLIQVLTGPREVLAVGTVFPNEEGRPLAHIHAAAGREGGATVGCTRAGLTTWLIGEVVLLEILGTAARRAKDAATGFELLEAANETATLGSEGLRAKTAPGGDPGTQGPATEAEPAAEAAGRP